jgi:selenocysteine-specific elongation factor
MLDVHLNLLPGAPHPLKNLVKVRFHHSTSEVLARVAFLGRESLAPGSSAYAQLRLDYSVFCLHGDTFILRQFSPPTTIGGGTVLHPHPVKHKTTDSNAMELLEHLKSAGVAEKIPILIKAHRGSAMNLEELNSLLGHPEATLREYCAKLAQNGQVVLIPAPVPILLLPSTIERLERDTLEMIEHFYGQNPLQKGIPREELRKRVYDGLPMEVFRFCLDALAAKRKIAFQEETVSLHGREVQLSPEGERIRELIESVYLRAAYQPPPIDELPHAVQAAPEEVRKIYFWMLKEKILVKVSDDMAYHRQALQEIKQRILASYPRGAKFGVAEFKSLFDLTRKHAIPLLEYLDREKFTRRLGNDRVLL